MGGTLHLMKKVVCKTRISTRRLERELYSNQHGSTLKASSESCNVGFMASSSHSTSYIKLVLRTLFLLTLLHSCPAASDSKPISKLFSRNDFPKDFVFGAGSASFQYEGAVKEDGRKPSIWDVFSHLPGKIKDGSNADVAADHYHRYKEDIGILADMGGDAFRFSLSWTRIIPDGTGAINQKGIDHYNDVINECLRKGLKPYVTLFHWDLPLALENAYGGLLSPQFAKDFAAYAEVAFEKFGDRVKAWTTLNEPHTYTIQGYTTGLFAPGRCSKDVNNCTGGNSATEPYVVAHHLLLGHAAASAVYNKKFKASQGGEIGITLDAQYYFPYTKSKKDKAAVQRSLLFNVGWFLDPVIFGDYPQVMKTRVGSRLPKFTKEEAALLKVSADFIGINHYTTFYVADTSTRLGAPNLLQSPNTFLHPAYYKDTHVAFLDTRGGKLIGQNINGFYIVPAGIRGLMNFIRLRYKNPKVYITESGISDLTNDTVPLKQQLNDVPRLAYYQGYLRQLATAIRDDECNVKAYFAWSFLDTWEWFSGFSQRFGLIHIDFAHGRKRIPKNSAKWFKKFLKS